MAASALQGTETDAADADTTAGELLVDIASYWKEALPEERRDIVCTLLSLNGLIYELERSTIVGRTPRTDILRVLTLGLTPRWEQRANGLWLRDAFLPPSASGQIRTPRCRCSSSLIHYSGSGHGNWHRLV